MQMYALASFINIVQVTRRGPYEEQEHHESQSKIAPSPNHKFLPWPINFRTGAYKRSYTRQEAKNCPGIETAK